VKIGWTDGFQILVEDAGLAGWKVTARRGRALEIRTSRPLWTTGALRAE
jgi:hypothetical protein